MTEEELRAKQVIKKQKQHAAWAKWYRSEKGAAYRQKLKEKRSADDTPSQSAK